MRGTGIRRYALGLLVLALAIAASGAAYAADEGWLGVMLQPLTGDLKGAMNIGTDVEGVLVNDVVTGSPAEAAGFQKGDVLIEVDGTSVKTPDEAIAAVRGHAPGDRVKFVAIRNGKHEVMTATLAKREVSLEVTMKDEGAPEEAMEGKAMKGMAMEGMSPECSKMMKEYNIQLPRIGKMIEDFTGEEGGYLGVTVYDMTSDLASYFGVEPGEGVLVLDVIDDTPAAEAGLRGGDVITKIDGDEVSDAEELVSCLGEREPGETVEVTFKRTHETRRVEVELAEQSPARIFIKRVMGPGECGSEEWGPGGGQSMMMPECRMMQGGMMEKCPPECMERCMKMMQGCTGMMEKCPPECMEKCMKMMQGGGEGSSPRCIMIMKGGPEGSMPEGMKMMQGMDNSKMECMEMMRQKSMAPGEMGMMRDDLKAQIEDLKQEIKRLQDEMDQMKK